MNKLQIINDIEKLYPADCYYEDTAHIGKVLLEKAKIKIGYIEYFSNWRNYPEIVLNEYLNQCRDYNIQSLLELFTFIDRHNKTYSI